MKNSDKAYGKDVYYRFIKEKRYNGYLYIKVPKATSDLKVA